MIKINEKVLDFCLDAFYDPAYAKASAGQGKIKKNKKRRPLTGGGHRKTILAAMLLTIANSLHQPLFL